MITPYPSSATPTCVVDANEAFRNLVVSHFATNGLPSQGFEDSAAFFKSLRHRRPACVILDLGLPDMNGMEVQRMLVSQYSSMPLIFVANDAPVSTVANAIRMGAFDFVLKPVDLDALLGKARAAVEEGRQFDARDMRREDMRRRLHTLTAREHHILSLALTGKSNKEISQLVGISHRTVETHRAHILQKIGVANLLELAHIFADLRPYVGDGGQVTDAEHALGAPH